MLGMVGGGGSLGLQVGRTAVCVKSWGGSFQSWEVKASLKAQRSGRGAGVGVKLEECAAVRGSKQCQGGKAVRGEGQSCCAGRFSLMSCATCTPSIVEQVSTRLTVGFILLENSVPQSGFVSRQGSAYCSWQSGGFMTLVWALKGSRGQFHSMPGNQLFVPCT